MANNPDGQVFVNYVDEDQFTFKFGLVPIFLELLVLLEEHLWLDKLHRLGKQVIGCVNPRLYIDTELGQYAAPGDRSVEDLQVLLSSIEKVCVEVLLESFQFFIHLSVRVITGLDVAGC